MILFLNIVAYKVKPPYVTTKRWPSKTPGHPQTFESKSYVVETSCIQLNLHILGVAFKSTLFESLPYLV